MSSYKSFSKMVKFLAYPVELSHQSANVVMGECLHTHRKVTKIVTIICRYNTNRYMDIETLF